MTLGIVTLLSRPHEIDRLGEMFARARRLTRRRVFRLVVCDWSLANRVSIPWADSILDLDDGLKLWQRYERVRRFIAGPWIIDAPRHWSFVDDDDIIAETHFVELDLRSTYFARGADQVLLTDGKRMELHSVPSPVAAWTQAAWSRDVFREVPFVDSPAPDTRFMLDAVQTYGAEIQRSGPVTYACRIHPGNTRARFKGEGVPLTCEALPPALRGEYERIRAWAEVSGP